MIRNAADNTLKPPSKGWMTDENGYFIIDYFSGDPYPESVASLSLNTEMDETDNEECAENSSSDDEYGETDDSDDEWEPSK